LSDLRTLLMNGPRWLKASNWPNLLASALYSCSGIAEGDRSYGMLRSCLRFHPSICNCPTCPFKIWFSDLLTWKIFDKKLKIRLRTGFWWEFVFELLVISVEVCKIYNSILAVFRESFIWEERGKFTFWRLFLHNRFQALPVWQGNLISNFEICSPQHPWLKVIIVLTK
jgi:hypothetical protein